MEAYAALARLSAGYSPLEGRSPTYYSPVRHCTTVLLRLLVRLACVKRAASVRSEPGSNSQKETSRNFNSRAATSIHHIQFSKSASSNFWTTSALYARVGFLSTRFQFT